jgi:hypothetical protein
MDNPKIDAPLADEIQRAADAGEPDRMLAVEIEHAEPAVAPTGTDPAARLDELGRTVRRLQAGIVEQLKELGAQAISQETLANVVTARLSADGVRQIAQRDDVRAIRLTREQQVTT